MTVLPTTWRLKTYRAAFTRVIVVMALVVLLENVYNGRHKEIVKNLPKVRIEVPKPLRDSVQHLFGYETEDANMDDNPVGVHDEGVNLESADIAEIEDFQARLEKLAQLDKRNPKALIIGMMKCGTYALRTFIGIHPQIAAPVGEINFFNKNYKKGKLWYRAQMPASLESQVTIEKSIYFTDPHAPKRVYEFDKDMKLFVILRDPVRRAISHYTHMKAIGKVPEGVTFEEMVLDIRTGTLKLESLLIQAGLYSTFIQRWLKYFSYEQIQVVDGDTFVKDPFPALVEAERFLGLSQKITKENLYFDSFKGFFCYVKRGKRRCLPEGKGRVHPVVTKDVIDKLYAFFRPHNEQLFRIIRRRLSWQPLSALKGGIGFNVSSLYRHV